MSRKRRREGGVGIPQSSAGLMRFFQDESNGIKIPPELVLVFAVILISSVIAARIFF